MDSFLDKFIRWLRLRKIIGLVPEKSIVCDLGCGKKAVFLKSIRHLIESGIGLDKKIEDSSDSNLILKKSDNLDKVPLEKESIDVVTMMAVLEHLENPRAVLKESFRILKNEGKLILTTPSPKAKTILEFLAFKMNLIDKNEIKDHKNYFWPRDIINMLIDAGFKEENIKTKYFEWRFNILTIATKIL